MCTVMLLLPPPLPSLPSSSSSLSLFSILLVFKFAAVYRWIVLFSSHSYLFFFCRRICTSQILDWQIDGNWFIFRATRQILKNGIEIFYSVHDASHAWFIELNNFLTALKSTDCYLHFQNPHKHTKHDIFQPNSKLLTKMSVKSQKEKTVFP